MRDPESRTLRLVLVVLLTAVTLVSLLLTVAGCDDYRHVRLEDRPGAGISLTTLWEDVARAAECDPGTTSLKSFRLEYAQSGRLNRAVIDGVTERGEFLQVYLSGKSKPDSDPLQCGVSISPPDSTWMSSPLTPGAPVFSAIDLVGSSNMIALLPPAGYGGFYTFVSAYEMTTPLQPIDPSAIAYRWDGAGFRELAPGDELRQFPGGYQYLVGHTAKLVSSSSTDDEIVTQHQSDGKLIYFVIPTPGVFRVGPYPDAQRLPGSSATISAWPSQTLIPPVTSTSGLRPTTRMSLPVASFPSRGMNAF